MTDLGVTFGSLGVLGARSIIEIAKLAETLAFNSIWTGSGNHNVQRLLKKYRTILSDLHEDIPNQALFCYKIIYSCYSCIQNVLNMGEITWKR